MYKKLVLIAFGFLLCGATLNAQRLVKFQETTKDFGEVKEADTPRITHTFSFANASDGAVKVFDVKASGHRVTPTWTPGAIQSGRNGSVLVSMDLRGQVGPFNQALVVKTAPFDPASGKLDTAAASNNVLYLKGSVIARERSPEEIYHHEDGNLRMTNKYVNFGTLTDKEQGEKTVTLYNQGEEPITIISAETQEFVKVTFPEGDRVIQPKGTLELNVEFDGAKANDYYWKHSSITLVTDDTLAPSNAQNARKRLSASATILPDFSEMSEKEKESGPRIAFDKTDHDFGDITEGDVVKTTFKFTNTGKSELKILKTKASCGCTATEPEKKVLQPGETSSIKVTFNSAHKSGPQHKSINIVTNDPANPMTRLGIKSQVAKKPEAAPVGE